MKCKFDKAQGSAFYPLSFPPSSTPYDFQILKLPWILDTKLTLGHDNETPQETLGGAKQLILARHRTLEHVFLKEKTKTQIKKKKNYSGDLNSKHSNSELI